MKKTILALAGVAAAAAGFTAPLSAHSHDSMMLNEVEIFYGDLDLSSDVGVNVLDRRIASAAREVCGGHPRLSNILELSSFHKCTAKARADVQDAKALAISGEGDRMIMASGPQERAVSAR